jgi:excisionase family DNA binding protein
MLFVYLLWSKQMSLRKGYYTVEEVAEYYAVSPETVRRMCREGKIPGAKQFGRQWRIPIKFLEETPTIQETDEDKKDQQH